MRPRSLAVLDDLVAIAAGVHQGVGEDWHVLESALIVNGARQVENGGRLPARIERHGAEGIANNLVNSLCARNIDTKRNNRI